MLVLGVAVTLFASLPLPADGHSSDDVKAAEASRDRAYTRVQRVQDDLDAALIRYDQVHTELDDVEERVDRTKAQLGRIQEDESRLRDAARDAVIDAYTGGGVGELSVPIGTDRVQDLMVALYVGARIRERQAADLNQLSVVARQVSRLEATLSDEQASVAILAAEAADASTKVQAALDTAQHELADAEQAFQGIKAQFEEEQRRKREAELARIRASKNEADRGLPASATGSFVCPVQGGAAFIDSWGFPRSGGRRHKGVDMFAKRGTPTPAVTDGTVKMRTVNLGGIVSYLYGDDGNKYYYAHLNGYPDGLRDGQRVKKGQPIGFVGNSGNAEGTSPHLHFEIRPGGSNAVNPYPTVRPACP